MPVVSPHSFVNRRALINQGKPRDEIWADPVVHRRRVMRELKAAELSRLAQFSSEASYLPYIIHTNEHIEAAVFGRSKAGLVMLVATDRRIIFLDKKPLFEAEDEINFTSVNGISWGSAGFGSTVCLHTRVVDYNLSTYSQKSARKFAHYIEKKCLENPALEFPLPSLSRKPALSAGGGRYVSDHN